MARSLPKYRLAESSWSKMKAQCPVCNNTFSSWYCPNCGLPKNNNAYYEYEGETFYCGSNHFRREFGIVREYQLCSKCFAPNPYNAKYCRNCREEIYLQAKDKNGHGWVDLGLSVLWSAETIDGLYLWNHSKIELSTYSDMYDYLRVDTDNKDIATIKWGAKWRTPTKDEFEELVIKCKWEKCLDPVSKKHALKATGPNGNYIIIPVTGHAGCSCSRQEYSPIYKPENIHSECSFWTSTENPDKPRSAYAFRFIGYDSFIKTLTARESKELWFKIMRPIGGPSIYDDDFDLKWKLEKQREEEERKVLQSMGDDSCERRENQKKDNERRQTLWLETPIEFISDMNDCLQKTIHSRLKRSGYAIRPVADKKWQGRL